MKLFVIVFITLQEHFVSEQKDLSRLVMTLLTELNKH